MTPTTPKPTTPKPGESTDLVIFGFLGGEWVPQHQMVISVDDGGFRQGVTAVERLRTYGHAIFELNPHLDRWQHSTSQMGIAGLPPLADIDALLQELLSRNQQTLDLQGEVGITLFATPGTAASEAATFGMHINRLDLSRIQGRQESGQALVVTDIQQPSPQCWPRTIKVRSRLHYHLADQVARQIDPTASGVLVDNDGTITETSISNIAIVKAEKISSPPRDRVLRGITQAFVEQMAREIQIDWSTSPITTTDLLEADEVLLMGTDGGLWFANSVNENAIGQGEARPTYQALQQQFQSKLDAVQNSNTSNSQAF
jgi:branched-subunit amino acid aminotransferase/4-amino-4-deoxychorismate lyase